MPPKNSGASSKSPGGRKVIHTTAQTAFVRVVTPHKCMLRSEPRYNDENRKTFPQYNDIISIHSQIKQIIEFCTITLQ